MMTKKQAAKAVAKAISRAQKLLAERRSADSAPTPAQARAVSKGMALLGSSRSKAKTASCRRNARRPRPTRTTWSAEARRRLALRSEQRQLAKLVAASVVRFSNGGSAP